MRVRPSLIAAASISAAINRLGLVTDSSCQRLLADLVTTDADQLATLVRSVESLMAAQLASVQQQEQQHHLQQQQQQQQQHPHVKSSKMPPTSSSWELDVQPETPTDIQDIHFWHARNTSTNPPKPEYLRGEKDTTTSSASDGRDSITWLSHSFLIPSFFYN